MVSYRCSPPPLSLVLYLIYYIQKYSVQDDNGQVSHIVRDTSGHAWFHAIIGTAYKIITIKLCVTQ